MNSRQNANRQHLLITGIRGFVGTNLMEYLRYYNEVKITGASRDKSSLTNLKEKISGIISEREIIENDARFDVYVHLSGKVYDLKDKNNDQEYFEANFDATKELFDHFIEDKNAKKFIFLSTIHVLTENPEIELDESYNPKPFTPYGKSKYKAEQYIQHKCPPDKDYYILRPSMIHGPGNKGNLNLLFNLVNKGIPYPVGAYNNRRSFVSIENLCFVIKELILNDIEKGLYHVSDDEATYTHDLIKIIADVTNQKPRMVNIPPGFLTAVAKIGDFIPIPLNTHRLNKLTGDFIVSNHKLKTAIGKPFPVEAEEGLRLTLNTLNQ